MPENYYSLSQITEHLEKLISKTYAREYWIKAEIIKLNYYPKSGHCYPDLVEKSNSGIKAQIRGLIWKGNFINISKKFRDITGKELHDGMEILFKARINFQSNYGLSLHISDIDPHYTLGKMASEKLQCIQRLKAEGLFFMNKSKQLPLLPQKIAVISVASSKGYQDFVNIIENNSRNYRFYTMLFPAILQGDTAIDSIGKQLDRIRVVAHHFDLAVIIRGGGGDVGLACYNDYALARNVATFPIPIISGIGHSTNETVVEMISHKNTITPTDLAYFLQQKFDNLAVRTQEIQEKIENQVHDLLEINKTQLKQLGQEIAMHQKSLFTQKQNELFYIDRRLKEYAKKFIPTKTHQLLIIAESLKHLHQGFFKTEMHQLEYQKNRISQSLTHHQRAMWAQIGYLQEKIKLMDPAHILKQGYSITRLNGKAITSIENIESGEIIETQLHKGKIKSKTI